MDTTELPRPHLWIQATAATYWKTEGGLPRTRTRIFLCPASQSCSSISPGTLAVSTSLQTLGARKRKSFRGVSTRRAQHESYVRPREGNSSLMTVMIEKHQDLNTLNVSAF